MPPEPKVDDEPEIRVVEETDTLTKDVPEAGQHFTRETPRQRQEGERKPPSREAPSRERNRSSDNRFADDEDEPLGPRVQKRINQFRRRTGDAEARAAALEAENRRLLGQVHEASASAMAHYESAANARLDAAKREHLEAYESGDGQKVVEASRKLASAQNALDSVDAVKARQKAEAARPAAEQPQQQQRPTYSAQTQDWIDDNRWFETDQRAKEDAIRIHDRLVRQGYTPDTQEYFKELTARCRTMFPEHFDGDGDDTGGDDEPLPKTRAERRADEESRRAPPVAGVSRTTTTGRRVTEVKLTKEMIEAAAIAGVHPKKYAEQYLALRKEGKI